MFPADFSLFTSADEKHCRRPMTQPDARSRAARRADFLLAATASAVVLLYAWIAAPARSDWGNADPRDAYYNLLVDGFTAGQLHLKADVPPGLAALPDPYDPEANQAFRRQHRLHDVSYYDGKLHLYYGVTPALVLFGPYHWLTGGYLLNKQAVFVFSALGFLASTALLRACWRRYFPAVPGIAVALAVAALGLLNSIPELLRIPAVCEVAISCGYAFVMVALLALWYALHADRHSVRWLAVASASYGLAVAARPSLLFGTAALLVPVVAAWREHRNAPGTVAHLHGRSRQLLAALLPLMLVGCGLAAYNYARFGDIFEFGQQYQLASDRQDTARHFNLGFLSFNWRVYFLSWVPWTGTFPFLAEPATLDPPPGHVAVESGHGILTNTPLNLFAFALVFLWRENWRERFGALRVWLIAAMTVFATSTLVIGSYYWTVLRYQTEFQPVLTLLACIGVFVGEKARVEIAPGILRRLWRPSVAGACLYSAAFVALTNIKMLANELNRQAVVLAESGRPDDAMAALEAALRVAPHSHVTHGNLGALYLASGNAARAAEHYARALAADPQSADSLHGAGLALAALGQYKEAAAHFRATIRLKPRLAVAHSNLATMLFHLGEFAGAAAHYQRAVELGHAAPGLRESLDLARRAAAEHD
jgi:hypothetical protein